MSDVEPGNRTEHTLVTEAQNRHHWQDKEAYGEVDGDKVYLVARLKGHGTPELIAMVGGEWYHYPEEDMEDEYVRHTSHSRRFDRVDRLQTAFGALVEMYGLQEDLPESWKEENA